MKKLLACALALLMMCTCALAEGKSYSGTVVSTGTEAVLAPAAGVIGEVMFQAGDKVSAGDEVAALKETIVYAENAGTVRVFGKAGDAVATLVTRYGAVVYIEPERSLTLTGNTSYAYDAVENRNIHPGETVYLKSVNSNIGHSGTGLVTVVSGSKFTVEVLDGDIVDEDIVYIYRQEAGTLKSRIGRGTVSYTGATAVSGAGTGVVSDILVADGAYVEAGTPLFATVESTAYNWQMASPATGVVSSVSVAPGDAVEAGALIAQIYPDSAMRFELVVEGEDLRSIRVGDAAQITFDNGMTAAGSVERVSGVPYVQEVVEGEEADDTVYFAVYVAFAADAEVPYGMTGKAVIGE